MADPPDLYRILQVDPGADPDVIGAAFRALARRLHPDRDPTGIDDRRMAELNRAYGVLRDPEQRRAYDASRGQASVAVGPGREAPPDPGGLAARTQAAAARRDAEPDATRLDFGRYAGLTLREIARRDSDYLAWLSRHSSGIRFRREIGEILRETGAAGR